MLPLNTQLIWEECNDVLRQFIARRVSNNDDVDDILQDVFIKIHNNIDDLEQADRWQAWIYQITRNTIIDYYRKKRPNIDLTEEMLIETIPEENLTRRVAQWLTPLVEELPNKYRQAIQLTEFEGLSQKELGQRLGLSNSGTKSRVQRARQQLKAMVLTCCHVEFDRVGNVIDYHEHSQVCDCCASCVN